MNLPKVISDLVEAQNSFDIKTYAECFSPTAEVFDEGKMHKGRKEIENWIADANERYSATMQPLTLEAHDTESILKAKITGNFEGSPIVLNYHLKIADELIQSLRITG